MQVVSIWIGLALMGTGFVVEYKGEKKVLTNWHVCFPLSIIQGTVNEEPTTVYKSNMKSDLCLLNANLDYKAIKLANKLVPGEYVKTSGYPNRKFYSSGGRYVGADIQTLGFDYHLSRECPVGLTKSGRLCIGEYVVGTTTLFTDHGASGSPVVNRYGKLVGVMQMMDDENHGGMVLLETIREFLDE